MPWQAVPRSAQCYVVEGAVLRVHSGCSVSEGSFSGPLEQGRVLNPIDLLILVLVVGGGFLGWVNGVVKWLFTFLGFIVGVVVASRLYKTFDWAIPFVDSDGLRQFIVFALILTVIVVGRGCWDVRSR